MTSVRGRKGKRNGTNRDDRRLAGLLAARHLIRRPGDDILSPGEMQQRRSGRQANASRIGHRVDLDARLGGLQLPRRMVNLEALRLERVVDRVETVALGQEMLQGPGLRLYRRSDGPIGRL